MRALGIPEKAIGIFGKRGFNPTGCTAGGNVRTQGIEVDAAVFNDLPGFDAWNRASVSARVDAVIAHEFAEFGGMSHAEAVKLGPQTALAISDEAREILKAMAEL